MRRKNEDRKMLIYAFIKEFIKEYGVSPSLDEIGESLHLAKSTIHKYIIRLEDEGAIERLGHNQIIPKENIKAVEMIPVVGAVACGKPKLAIEDIQAYIPISRDLLGRGEYIILIADGDSMIEAGIDSGDLVFIRKQATAEEGQIVVAMVESEYSDEVSATLKRFYKDTHTHKIRLHPENRYMSDIIVDDIKIIGVAVKVLKNVA